MRLKTVFFFTLSTLWLGTLHAEPITLYVDSSTGQVFTQPGAGRQKLGRFEKVQEEGNNQQVEISQSSPSLPSPSQQKKVETVVSSTPVIQKHWYDKLSARGYFQFRYTSLWEKEGASWFSPTDRTVASDQTFLIRRARLILSGDVSDHLFLYVQPDLNASPSDGDFSVQLRDFYGDLALNQDKSWRVRIGQSKVPYGFVNMQSSQNRAPLERADAINSAVEGERDLGVFLYWAPKEIRDRFRKLVADGLKGSGDYGVFGIGAYSGQGLNRTDLNSDTHMLVRATYPFQFANGQYFEPSLQAYTGRFVPRTKPFNRSDEEQEFEPSYNKGGVKDERIALTTVLYPQPFGVEAEWNIGRGPELSDDYGSIKSQFLQGGYVQANMKIESTTTGLWFPFIRWQLFNGGRKFARNAPQVKVNEWDFGVEWTPYPELEFTAMYSYTRERTNSNVYPYEPFTDGSRLGVQAQLNF